MWPVLTGYCRLEIGSKNHVPYGKHGAIGYEDSGQEKARSKYAFNRGNSPVSP